MVSPTDDETLVVVDDSKSSYFWPVFLVALVGMIGAGLYFFAGGKETVSRWTSGKKYERVEMSQTDPV